MEAIFGLVGQVEGATRVTWRPDLPRCSLKELDIAVRPNVEAVMGAAENLGVHTRWSDAENSHDLSHHEDFIHNDIEVRQPGAEPVIGIESYRAMMETAYGGVPDFRVVLDDQFATDDRVVCTWRMSGTHTAESFGFPATGKEIEVAGVSVWEFEDGKARRGRIFMDLPALMAQLGT
jgi:steroid delta-isomerase-like uncharacterized protein